AVIADKQGSNATLNLNNGRFQVSGSLFAGEEVIEGLQPSLGGNATIALGASSSVEVEQGDLTAGNAQITGQSASTLRVNGNVILGNLLGSTATMTITGAGSKLGWAQTLEVGQQPGTGTLNIQAGGSAAPDFTDRLASLAIGGQGSGTVTVDGNGSSLEATN